MATYQESLIKRILATGCMQEVINLGLTSEDFTESKCHDIWNLIQGYYHSQETKGSIISERMLHLYTDRLDSLDDSYPGDTTASLFNQVRKQRIHAFCSQVGVEFDAAINTPGCNQAQILAAYQDKLSYALSLTRSAGADMDIGTGVQRLWNEIEYAKQGIDKSVMHWPWDPLQRETFGVQPEDYIILYGRPKSMKTWVLAYLVSCAFNSSKKALVYTKEMTPDNIYARITACICGLDYSNLRAATSASAHRPLSPEDEARLCGLLGELKRDIRLSSMLKVLSGRDVAGGADTVPWLRSKVEQHKPDVLFVDGVYLMAGTDKKVRDDQRVMGISRALRDLALETHIPIIGTLQANRKAAGHGNANLDEIAYSDAVGQDATIAARVMADKQNPFINIVIGGSREFKLHGIRINARPAYDFTFHSELTEKEIEKAKEADSASDAENKEPKKAQSRNGKSNNKKANEESENHAQKHVQEAKRAGAFNKGLQ
jgi:replicative DNA helicase